MPPMRTAEPVLSPTTSLKRPRYVIFLSKARRLLPMAENAVAVIAIELLAAAQGCDFHAPLRSSEALEAVRVVLRSEVPTLQDDRYLQPDIKAAIDLIRGEAVIEAAGPSRLPAIG